jgi:hypothetical protein
MLYKVPPTLMLEAPPTWALQQAPPLLSAHSFRGVETQSPTTLNFGPTRSQALAIEGTASMKEG